MTPTPSLDRPILITGTPRSGKSVVRRIISAADEFHSVPEPLMVWNPGTGGRVDDRCTAADATPRVRRRIRDDCLAMVRRAGKQRYVDDLSYHALRIPFVRAVMPEARIIHVVRDGQDAIPELLYGWTYRDTVSGAVTRRWRSLRWRGLPRAVFRFTRNYLDSRVHGRRSTWGPRPPGLEQFAAEHDAAEVAAYQWRMMVQIAMDDLSDCPPDTWLQVRLDRLLADPGPELERLAAFCQPRDPRSVVQHGLSFINPHHQFEKKVQPTEAQWEKIRQQIGPIRARLGYQQDAAEHAQAPQP